MGYAVVIAMVEQIEIAAISPNEAARTRLVAMFDVCTNLRIQRVATSLNLSPMPQESLVNPVGDALHELGIWTEGGKIRFLRCQTTQDLEIFWALRRLHNLLNNRDAAIGDLPEAICRYLTRIGFDTEKNLTLSLAVLLYLACQYYALADWQRMGAVLTLLRATWLRNDSIVYPFVGLDNDRRGLIVIG